VVKKLHDDSDLSGYITPDMYSEPYKNGVFVNFTATDGLGRLKGKNLMIIIQMKNVDRYFLSMFEINGHELDLYFNRQSKICE
jgi:hypothetical protein